MSSQVLRDARKYEEEKEREITPEMRPAFHLSSRVGWMNDPNGFSFYQGKFHLFHQYHPYRSIWGPMHWAHATTTDLLHWAYLPCALAPDMDYDRDGCFSGNALTMPDGRQLLMYTSVKNEEKDGRTLGIQTQSIAIGDGIEYEKYDKNPVIDKKLLPKDCDCHDFRDPKMWQEKDGTYRAIMANRNTKNKSGRMLLFASDDGIRWRFLKVLIENNDRIGLMWECPDFFELDGKQVLIGSAMDMIPEGLKYYNGNGTFYMIGDYDNDKEEFKPDEDHAVDYGIDFYAPQTVEALDGRRILIAWMQNWDTCNLHTPDVSWFGQMCLPRELSVKNGRLYQTPVRELMNLRSNKIEHKDIRFSDGEIYLPGIKGRIVDLNLDIRAAADVGVYQKFAVRFAADDKYHTAVSFRPQEGIIKLDRKFSGSRRAIMHQRRAAIGHRDGSLKLRIILDRFSAEIFVDDGYKVMTTTIDTDPGADGISFYVDGEAYLSAVKYDLA